MEISNLANAKIMIGSKNPAKINAVKSAFQSYQADFFSVNVPSGVSEQPFSDEETIKGAINRANAARMEGNGDIGIGLEGGVQETEYGLFLCNWGALAEKDMPMIIAGGARILLPEVVAKRLKAGEELGPVMEDFSHIENVRKSEGAIGIFTNGEISRITMFTHVSQLLFGQYMYRKNY